MNTVEGALVMTALATLLAGCIAALITLGMAMSVTDLARDAARVEALGGDAADYISSVKGNTSADVSVSHHRIEAGTEEDIVVATVTISTRAPLMTVQRSASVVVEP